MKKAILSLLLFLKITLLSAQSQSVKIAWNGDSIHGTMLQADAKASLVIIIPGSGPTDRNGNSNALSGKNNSYKMLADSLLKHDINTFRYDKPGIGESQKAGTAENEMRFEDNPAYVQKLVNHFHEDYEKIVLLGHSEGSLIAMLTAPKAKAEGIISVAGAAQNAGEVIREQINGNQILTDSLKNVARQLLDSLQNGHQVNNYPFVLTSLFRKSVQPYLISWMRYTPTKEIAKLEVPVLIIGGDKDLQVPLRAARELHQAAGSNSRLLTLPKMNHVLKKIEKPENNHKSYTNPNFPLQPGLASGIAQWIESL